MLVIIHHWVPPGHILNSFPNGNLAVDCFFVLSGFLITRVLLESRYHIEAEQLSRLAVLKSFYLRRILRLFPAYYLLLIILVRFEEYTNTSIGSSYPYFFTYTSNFFFYQRKSWDGMISHFWSLAVEEQFYLFWPFVVLYLRRRFLVPAMIILTLAGSLTQHFSDSAGFFPILTFTCFDAFGLGGILAWLVIHRRGHLRSWYTRLRIAGLTCLGIWLLGFIPEPNEWNFIPFRTLNSVMALWLIGYVVINSDKPVISENRLLNNPVLLLLGKMSYSIYLYHLIIPKFYNDLRFGNFYSLAPGVLTAENTDLRYWIEISVILLVVSWLSYTFIEKTFIRLKKYALYPTSKKLAKSDPQVPVLYPAE